MGARMRRKNRLGGTTFLPYRANGRRRAKARGRLNLSVMKLSLVLQGLSTPFVAKGKATRGPDNHGWQAGVAANGGSSWSPGEAKEEKTGVPSAKGNILSIRGGCKGI